MKGRKEEKMEEKSNNIEAKKTGIVKSIIAIILFFTVSLGVTFVYIVLKVMKHDTSATEIHAAMPGWVTLLPFIVLLPIFIVMYYGTLKTDIKRMTKEDFKWTGIFAGLSIATGFAATWLFSLFGYPISNQEAINEIFSQIALVTALATIIGAPVAEEIVFRKALNGIVKNTSFFVVLSALLFGLMHYSGIATITYVVLGAIYALAYIKTDKNVVAAIIAHSINNAFAILYMLMTLGNL